MSTGDAFWCALALNFSACCLGLTVLFAGHWDLGLGIPLVCLALTGGVGLVALLTARTRRIGGGLLWGFAASVLGFAAVVSVLVVGYFVIGGNELS